MRKEKRKEGEGDGEEGGWKYDGGEEGWERGQRRKGKGKGGMERMNGEAQGRIIIEGMVGREVIFEGGAVEGDGRGQGRAGGGGVHARSCASTHKHAVLASAQP